MPSQLRSLICLVPACTVTKVDPEARATSSEPNFAEQTGFSRLSIAGVEQIKDSRRARFDFRDLTLTNTDAGLPVDHNRDIIIGGAGKPEIELTWALKPRPRAHVSKESRRWQGKMEPGLGYWANRAHHRHERQHQKWCPGFSVLRPSQPTHLQPRKHRKYPSHRHQPSSCQLTGVGRPKPDRPRRCRSASAHRLSS